MLRYRAQYTPDMRVAGLIPVEFWDVPNNPNIVPLNTTEGWLAGIRLKKPLEASYACTVPWQLQEPEEPDSRSQQAYRF